MKTIMLGEICNQITVVDFQDVDIYQENDVEKIVVIAGNYLYLITDRKISLTFQVGEKFNLVKSIPNYPHLFLLAKNTNLIVNESEDFFGLLEEADCECVIYNTIQQKITERYSIKNSQVHTISSWVDSEGSTKLSAFISQYCRKNKVGNLTFKKSYVDIFDTELEVISSYFITGITDEEVLTASSKGQLLLYMDNFNQILLINLETGKFVNQQLKASISSWPHDLNVRLGKFDLLSENSFAVHFSQDSFEFDFQGAIVSHYELSLDWRDLFEPVRILNEGLILVSNEACFGVASRKNSIKYIFE